MPAVLKGPGRPERYEVDGEVVPSVTTICGLWGDREYLVDWAVGLAKEGVDYREVRDRMALLGNCAHAVIEATIHGENWRLEAAADSCLLASDLTAAECAWLARVGEVFGAWLDREGVTITHTEWPLVSRKHMFGGTLDGRGVDRDGVLLVLDWKTSGRIRSSFLAQLGAYAVLLHENGLGLPEQARVVRVSREDARLEERKFSQRDLRDGWELFLHLRRAYDYSARLDAAVEARSGPVGAKFR